MRELAGQVLCAGFEGTQAPSELLDALRADALAGVVLFKRNLPDARHALALCRTLAEDASPLIAVDQEGGRVARLRAPVLELPPMRALASLGDPELTERCGALLGAQLRALGFTMDFAPVLDVDTNPDNPVIGDRSFGRTPDVVTTHALAFSRGLGGAGILACGKHFPGHGDTDLDSHLALPRLSHDRERLDRVELAPFRAATALPAWMSAHVIFEALDDARPATLSPVVIRELLRGELGYDGVVISDDLEMNAIADGWGVVAGAVAAIDAGCDLLLICSRLDLVWEARDAIAAKAEAEPAFRARLEDATARVRTLRRHRPAPTSLEAVPSAVALEAELVERGVA